MTSEPFDVGRDGSAESLDSFERRALAFLDERLSPRPDQSSTPPATDRVSLPVVGRTSEEEDERALSAARTWRDERSARGFGWIAGPREYGGEGLAAEFESTFDALEARFVAPDPSYLRTGISIVGPTIQRFGSQRVSDSYLPAIYSGESVVCQLFSEPDAGSDLANVQTKARRDGDVWVVSGQKVWSSGARHAALGECLVRVSGDGAKHAGLAMLLVDMTTRGIEVRPIRQMTGGAEFYEVFLDDVRVPDWSVLGSEDQGWAVTLDTLANERRTIGDQILPADWLRRRLVDATVTCGASTDPAVRQLLADAVIRLIIAKRLPSHLRLGDAPPAVGALTKLAASAAVERVCMAVSAALGTSLVADTGAFDSYSWSELVLGLPGLRIGGGTDEVLRSLVAERVLGLPRG